MDVPPASRRGRHRAVPERPADLDSDVPVSVILVAGLALVHLVMAASLGSISTAVIELVEPLLGTEPARLAATVTPSLPLAVVVLVWTPQQRRGTVAAVVVLALATLPYLRGVVLERLLDSGSQDAAVGFLDWTDWALTGLVPLGAVLGWSLARRRGRGWWPGLLVTVAVAAVFRLLDLDLFAGDPPMRRAAAALVYHVVPAVLGGLVCWWLDARRRTEEGR